MKQIRCSCDNDKWIKQAYGYIGTGTSWDVYKCSKCGKEKQIEVRQDTIEPPEVYLYEPTN